MIHLIYESRAYARLGMLDEARAAAEEALRAGCDAEIAQAWLVNLAYRSADFETVKKLGGELVARGSKREHVREYTALALHHLGDPWAAANLLLRIDEVNRGHDQEYLIACFLTAAGRYDEAARHLLVSFQHPRLDGAKTWLDGDLKSLWAELARGHFSLTTAHVLMEQEFDLLCSFQAEIGTGWELDPTNYDDLPEVLRAAMRFDSLKEAYVLDYAKAPPGSELAARFQKWVTDEVRTNQEHFDKAQDIAWERVLGGQPQYVIAACRRGDYCAARCHFFWTLGNDRERLMEFFGISEIKPLFDEAWTMLESDQDFFTKLCRANKLASTDPEDALAILDSLPGEWRTHPLLDEIRGHCLETNGEPAAGLECLLRACAQMPDDADPFLRTMVVAKRHGWKEIARAIQEAAPVATRSYKIWAETSIWLNASVELYFPTTEFRGQPDLGGQIIKAENGEALRSRIPA